MAISQQGNLYSCQNFVGNKDFYLGNIEEGIDKKRQEKIYKNTIPKTKKECQACSVKVDCGGGCAFINYVTSGDARVSGHESCEVSRFKLGCARRVMNKLDELVPSS